MVTVLPWCCQFDKLNHWTVLGDVQKSDFTLVFAFICGFEIIDLKPGRFVVSIKNQISPFYQFTLGFGEIGNGTVDVDTTIFLVPFDRMKISTFGLINDTGKIDIIASFGLYFFSYRT